MNNKRTATLVVWDTRNWRHNKKALTYCKNYGLMSLTQKVFVGDLYVKERVGLHKAFRSIFIRKTENFFFVTLCESCFENALIDSSIKEKFKKPALFEILQFPEKARKH